MTFKVEILRYVCKHCLFKLASHHSHELLFAVMSVYTETKIQRFFNALHNELLNLDKVYRLKKNWYKWSFAVTWNAKDK